MNVSIGLITVSGSGEATPPTLADLEILAEYEFDHFFYIDSLT